MMVGHAMLVLLCLAGLGAVHTATVEHDLKVTLEDYYADCSSRPTVLINGEFQPTFRIKQGDTLVFNLINNLPANTSVYSEGISLHIHGLTFKSAPWFDGVSYVAHCPVKQGEKLTYTYLVNDPPGTYFFHDHSSGQFLFDGFQGILVVEGKNDKEVYGYDEELEPILMQEWWNIDGQVVVDQLDRQVAAPIRTTAFTGRRKALAEEPSRAARSLSSFCTQNFEAGGVIVGPTTMLVGGKGMIGDCTIFTDPSTLLPDGFCAPDQNPIVKNETCRGRSSYTVEKGSKYRMRFINGATAFTVLTVCVRQHKLTIFMLDARPVVPQEVECFDIEMGQRVDVILEANQAVDNYYLVVIPHIPGRAVGYSIINYKGVESAVPVMDTEYITQPDMKLWGPAKYQADPRMFTAAAVSMGFEAPLAVPAKADRVVNLNITQVLLRENGQSRFALNNVVHVKNPPCTPLLNLLRTTPNWQEKFAINTKPDWSPKDLQLDNSAVAPIYQKEGNGMPVIYLDQGQGVAEYPLAAMHVVDLKLGEVVDLVVQNNHIAKFNSDFAPNKIDRIMNDSHPMHIHGVHMWDLGRGAGMWTPASASTYNLKNPALRDTSSVPINGWSVMRFTADNPGVWFYHCHNLGHHASGLGLYIVVQPEKTAAPPASVLKCAATCKYNLHVPGTEAPVLKGNETVPPTTPVTPGTPSTPAPGANLAAVSAAASIMVAMLLVALSLALML